MGPVMVLVFFDRFSFETKGGVALSHVVRLFCLKENILEMYVFLRSSSSVQPLRVGEMYIVIVKCYLIWIVKQNLKPNAETHPKSKPSNVARLPKSPKNPQL